MAKARLGNAYDALSGQLGNNVLSNEQDGTGVRSHNPVSKQPNSPKQLARRAAMAKASQTWTTLDDATLDEWREYAAGLKKRNRLTGKSKNRTPKNVFSGCYAKLLQVSASSPLPQVPTESYSGAPITVQVQSVTGALVWTGNLPTPAGTLLECKAQRLPSRTAIPAPTGYLTMAIAPLEAGEGNEVSVPVSPGHWACSYRWVDALTGQETAEVPLATVSVTFAVEAGGAPQAKALKRAA